MTNLEKIQLFDADEMALFLYTVVNETEANFLKTLGEIGIDASIVSIPPEIQIAMHKKYLLQEVTENE